jgi:diaminopimelate epimerase
MRGAQFIKMHGLGNDFVVLDARRSPIALDDISARTIADRHLGVGCDQVIVIEPPREAGSAAFMRIRNADGGEVEACGNAARCVASLLMHERGASRVVLETGAGRLEAEARADGLVTVDMGPARTDWREIPLARAMDTLHVPLSAGPLSDPVCTSMGNPHATFFVRDAGAIDLATLGPRLEHDQLFPARANIGVAEVRASARLRLRVWERGAGLTPACGTGACAALVAAARRGLTARSAEIEADGGTMTALWREDGHVLLTGPASVSFSGVLDPSLLGPQ